MDPQAPPPLRVLLVEDDPVYARVLRGTLALAGGGPWSLEHADSLATATDRLAKGGIEAVLLDLHLPDARGVEAVRALCRAHPLLPVVVLTAIDDDQLGLAAVQAGAQDYLVKGPIHEQVLERALRYAIERKSTTVTLRQLEQAVRTMQLGVTVTDADGRILYANRAEAEMHGCTVAQLLGTQARELSPRENWKPMTREDLKTVRRWKRERVRLRRDGSVFPVQLLSDAVLDATGEPLGLITTCEDITERWKAEEALRRSEERYALAARGTNDGLWDWDLETGDAYFSPRWLAMLGHAEGDLRGRVEEWFSRIHPDDQARVQEKLRDHLGGRVERFEDEHRLRHRDGTWRWVLARGYAARARGGRALRMAGAQTDVTDRRAYDPLTGLPNRVLFLERLTDALLRARRTPGHAFAVLFVDLDHFKAVNDTFGHVAGDQLLTEVGHRLLSCVRPGDTVARFAGDEFAVLLERVQQVGDATGVADRIQASFGIPVRVADQDVRPSASIGIALSLSAYLRPEDVLRDADAAMYRAKHEGGGRWEVCDDALRERVAARARVRDDLRHAIDRGELGARYQPIVDLRSGAVIGLEVMPRWRGLLLPVDLLDSADHAPGLKSVEGWLLRESCRQAGAWSATRCGPPPLHVNVSSAQLLCPGFVEEVALRLRESGLGPGALVLEVAEEALLHDAAAVAGVLGRLRGLGVGVQLDGFGKGYAALSLLRRFRIDGVKLDASLVSEAAADDPSPLLAAVLAAASALGLPVVATGVEHARQAERLRGLACQGAQGSYFGEPLEATAAERLLDGPGAAPARAAS